MSDMDEQVDFKNLPTLLTEWKKIQEDRQKLVDEKKKLREKREVYYDYNEMMMDEDD